MAQAVCERKKELQPSLSVEEQIKNLKDLGLYIEDEEVIISF
jgi:hypothetical protein